MNRRTFLKAGLIASQAIGLRDLFDRIDGIELTELQGAEACGLAMPFVVPMVIGWSDGCDVSTREPEPSLVPTMTPSPTATATATAWPTATQTPTATAWPTATQTPTATAWPTATQTPTARPRELQLPVVMDAYDGR